MLNIKRKPHEKWGKKQDGCDIIVKIPGMGDMLIRLISMRSNEANIGFIAPPEVRIMRAELLQEQKDD